MLRKLLPETTFALILVLAWIVYQPGLSGGFLFDDYANLPAIGAYGPVDNATAFWRYLTSGTADPTGRPLALLSFLIDARTWPADPAPFKRTNVILHLVNGALLFLFLRQLGRTLAGTDDRARVAARWSAVVGAALWVLHPLFVSTTLYIVQREAMLPATFVLLGLIGYLAGRRRAVEGKLGDVWFAAASIGACTLLATLCKANGVLLPLLAWIVEAILLARAVPVTHIATRSAFRLATRIALVAPSVLVLAGLAYSGARGFLVDAPAVYRPWTLGERLLTEARVLVDYLALLWIPHPYSRGVFNDGYAASTGWLSPPSTLVCAIGLAGLFALAVVTRRKHPALAAAILFFFAGHLMESSVLPLELYFEHRNYVPALLMFWPLARWLCEPRADAPALHPLRRTLAFALPLLLAALTFFGASLWGNVAEQGLLWAALNPDSPRAEAYAAQIEMSRGRADAATVRLQRALAKDPDEIQLALNLIRARCLGGVLTPADLESARTSLRTTHRLGKLAFEWIDGRLHAPETARECPALDIDALETFVDAVGENPQIASIPGRRQDLANLRGQIALARDDAARALADFDDAFDAEPTPQSALRQAAMLATAGHPDLGLRHLDRAEQRLQRLHKPATGMAAIHDWLLRRQGYWENEFRELRKTLATERPRSPDRHGDAAADTQHAFLERASRMRAQRTCGAQRLHSARTVRYEHAEHA